KGDNKVSARSTQLGTDTHNRAGVLQLLSVKCGVALLTGLTRDHIRTKRHGAGGGGLDSRVDGGLSNTGRHCSHKHCRARSTHSVSVVVTLLYRMHEVRAVLTNGIRRHDPLANLGANVYLAWILTSGARDSRATVKYRTTSVPSNLVSTASTGGTASRYTA